MTLELLLVLPLVLIAICSIFMFTLLEKAEHRLVHASAQGCRVASQGGCAEDIRLAIDRSLCSQRLCRSLEVIIEPGRNSGDYCLVRLSVPARAVTPSLLRCVGFAIKDEKLIGQTVMRKE